MEASTVDEYNMRVEFERNYIIKAKIAEVDSALITQKRDSLRNDSIKRGFIKIAAGDSIKMKDSVKRSMATNILTSANIEDDTQKIRREVVDRKYYEGKFDDEIPVELFVRYMKDLSNGKVMYWDALYKFGDQENYIKLEVTCSGDKWEFDDDPPVGSMELKLRNRIYTGSWTNNQDLSGYDVVMKETPIAPRKLEKLDKILEEGLTARTDEPNVQETKSHKRKERKKKKETPPVKVIDMD
jgi:hypothetical protein